MTIKMVLLGIMAIMFLIPLQLIKMMIMERESNSAAVKMEISEQWGKQQIISGPVLNIPVYRYSENPDQKSSPVTRIWHILPESVEVNGRVNPEIRYKGIYETVIYDSDLEISGQFTIPDNNKMVKYSILWDEAYLTLGVSDNRGLKNRVSILFDGHNIEAEPGLTDQDLFLSGISFPVSVDPDKKEYSFTFPLGIKGTDGIYFTPIGKITTVALESDWNAPSFGGNFLPKTRTIDESGFSAEWEVTHLNRNFPQEWIGAIHDLTEESFGVDLILQVDHYRKSERSSKYGLLFIAFTFMVLLFIELSSEKRIHIFSYFLVSLALVLFFSLLNALSEHIGFNAAYLVASIATISLITGFLASLFKRGKPILIVGGLLTVLYIFLFFLLAMNEYAYLVGNIGLFIGLAAIMLLTAKTDLFRKNEF